MNCCNFSHRLVGGNEKLRITLEISAAAIFDLNIELYSVVERVLIQFHPSNLTI